MRITLAAMFATRHNGAAAPAAFGRVVLVASLGGMKAVNEVLCRLPADYPVPVVVTQHRRATRASGDILARVLADNTCLRVRTAETGAPADQPGVTVIPARTTATIDPRGVWTVRDAPGEMGVGDAVLASSAAQTPTIAVILTGRLADGSNGCRAVKRNGGRVLVQDPSTAEASGMPAHALATGCADFVLPLDRLAAAVLALTTAPGGAALLAVPLPPWASLHADAR